MNSTHPYRAAVDASAIFSEADLQGRITYVNPQFCEVSGYSADELLGQNHRLLNSGVHPSAFFEQMWATISRGQVWRGDICNRAKDGSLYWVTSTIVPLNGPDGLPRSYVSIRFDITPLHTLLESVQWQAHHDVLTGLPNRALLNERFGQAVAHAQRTGHLLAVCLLDVDGFKSINDSLGHAQGDALLVELARRLSSVLRPLDTAARLGGDEFVLLLTGLRQADEVNTVLTRVMAALSVPCLLGADSVEVAVSIGVSIYPTDDTTPDTLLRHADQALYTAKQAGRHRVHFFDVQHDHHAAAHYQMLARVTEALRLGQLLLHYQPKVNMRLGQTVGLEALIRWQHPVDGLIPPMAFLPLVEQTDVIVDVGEWVIDQALLQMATWQRDTGKTWPVSVNIAARHFQRADFAQRLTRALGQHPTVLPSMLEIEILESVAIDHVQQVQANIKACRALGVRFALDDFGTGYSSLSYLKSLPAHTLKIDRAFVRDILDDKDDLALIEAIIGLAAVFDRNVVAEGVENAEQGVLLMRLGCDVAQGFGIAKPMPAAAVPGWVAQYQPDPAWRVWGHTEWELSDFPLLVAQHDHLQWVKRVLMAVEGSAASVAATPLPDHLHCRFGHWYRTEGQRRYGHLAEYVAIDAVHRQVHALGPEIMGLLAGGDLNRARQRCAQLLYCKDQILALLHSLQHAVLRPKSDAPVSGQDF